MSRVINPNGVGKRRTHHLKRVVIALRELMQQTEPGDETRDLVAFIAGELCEISSTIDETVAAWEKRGYWVKADRFRLQWEWTEAEAEKIRAALRSEDWPAVAAVAARVVEKLSNVKVSSRHRMGAPWVGAWKREEAGTGGSAA